MNAEELKMGAEYDCGAWDCGDRFGRVTVRREPDGYHVVVVIYECDPLGLSEGALWQKSERLAHVDMYFSAAKDIAWQLSSMIASGVLDPCGTWGGRTYESL